MPLPSLTTELLKQAARTALADPVAKILGRRRQRGADAQLDPQVAAILELQRLLRLPALESMAPPRARRFATAGLGPLDVEAMPMDRIVDLVVKGRHGTIPVRRYEPPSAIRSPHLIVFFHGGGGVIGSVEASEPATRLLAHETGCTVASVDYRLGPEAPHPAAIDDACDAYEALAAVVAPGARVAIAGDSFGGYLVAHVDRLAARRPDLQVLIYPLVDQTLGSPSIERLAEGYLLTRSMIEYFRRHYLGDAVDRRAASPLFWPSLQGAAPAIVVTAGYDPLVDEGDTYAARLREAGVTVRHRRHPSLVHGFLSLAGVVRVARAATDEICDDIRAMLS